MGLKMKRRGSWFWGRVDTPMHTMITQEGPYFFINFLNDTENMFVMTSTEKMLCWMWSPGCTCYALLHTSKLRWAKPSKITCINQQTL